MIIGIYLDGVVLKNIAEQKENFFEIMKRTEPEVRAEIKHRFYSQLTPIENASFVFQCLKKRGHKVIFFTDLLAEPTVIRNAFGRRNEVSSTIVLKNVIEDSGIPFDDIIHFSNRSSVSAIRTQNVDMYVESRQGMAKLYASSGISTILINPENKKNTQLNTCNIANLKDLLFAITKVRFNNNKTLPGITKE